MEALIGIGAMSLIGMWIAEPAIGAVYTALLAGLTALAFYGRSRARSKEEGAPVRKAPVKEMEAAQRISGEMVTEMLSEGIPSVRPGAGAAGAIGGIGGVGGVGVGVGGGVRTSTLAAKPAEVLTPTGRAPSMAEPMAIINGGLREEAPAEALGMVMAAAEKSFEGEGRDGLEVTVRFNGADYTGSDVGQALDALEAKIGRGESMEAIRAAVAEEYGDAYETSAAVMADGRVVLSHRAAFEVELDDAGKVAVSRISCTKSLSSADKVRLSVHTHLEPIKDIRELYGDMIAMALSEHTTAKYNPEEYIIQRDGTNPLPIVSRLIHRGGIFTFETFNRTTNRFEKVAGMEPVTETGLLAAMDKTLALEGLGQLAAAQAGAILLTPASKANAFTDKIQEVMQIRFDAKIAAIAIVAELAKKGISRETIYGEVGKAAVADESVFHGLARALRETGVLASDCAAVVDLRSEEFNTKGMREAINRIASAGQSPLKIYAIADKSSAGLDELKNVAIIYAEGRIGEDLFAHVRGELENKGIKASHASIGLNEKNAQAAIAHIDANGDKAFNLLIANLERAEDQDKASLPALNVINILAKLATQKELSVMAVGCGDETVGRLTGLVQRLKNILRLIIIAREDIGRRVREFIISFTETSRSL
jgi:hypothetical protein